MCVCPDCVSAFCHCLTSKIMSTAHIPQVKGQEQQRARVKMCRGCQLGEQQPDVTIHWTLTRTSFKVLLLCVSQRRLSGRGHALTCLACFCGLSSFFFFIVPLSFLFCDAMRFPQCHGVCLLGLFWLMLWARSLFSVCD